MRLAGGLSHETARWGASAAAVVAAHAAAVALAVAWVRTPEVEVPEPPVLVDLPPLAAAEAVAQPQPAEPAPPTPQLPQPVSRVEVPPVRAPIPDEAVRLPPPAPSPSPAVQRIAPAVAAAPQTVVAPAPARVDASAGVAAGDDPKARKAEADYKALVGSHIRRNRFSPPQSRKAGLSGDVKVRFTVNRSGGISGVAVSQSSGHSLLDDEAVQFIQRLSPVPAFPRDLRKAEIPLSITLKFALESK